MTSYLFASLLSQDESESLVNFLTWKRACRDKKEPLEKRTFSSSKWPTKMMCVKRSGAWTSGFRRESSCLGLFNLTGSPGKSDCICKFRSVGTSSGSSSFTARFYKGSLKVSKVRARLDHKMTKLEKTRARNVPNEPDFCHKITK